MFATTKTIHPPKIPVQFSIFSPERKGDQIHTSIALAVNPTPGLGGNMEGMHVNILSNVQTLQQLLAANISEQDLAQTQLHNWNLDRLNPFSH